MVSTRLELAKEATHLPPTARVYFLTGRDFFSPAEDALSITRVDMLPPVCTLPANEPVSDSDSLAIQISLTVCYENLFERCYMPFGGQPQ